jgi:futalosine hydrolase
MGDDKVAIFKSRPDLAINAGIAGSFKSEFKPGDVVVPVSDCFTDTGIETAGGFQTLFDAGIEDPDKFPFSKGKINAGNKFITMATGRLRPVNAITVSTVTGSALTIERLTAKFNPDIETMEGATFFYICSRERLNFSGIRSLKQVWNRETDKWNIPLALDNLSEKLKEFVLMLD